MPQIDSTTTICLLLFGVIYGILVQEVLKRAPTSTPFLFMWVIGGVAATVLLLSPLIGHEIVVILAKGLTLTGAPVSIAAIAYYVRDAEKKSKESKMHDLDRNE